MSIVGRRGLLVALASAVTAACSKAAFLAVNAPTIFGSYQRHADLAYGAGPQRGLDVYVPTTPAKGPRPLIVFWHGGRWEYGDKSDYRFVGAALAELGFVTVVPNYRHYPEVKLAGFMEDAASAACFAAMQAAQFGADGDLFLMGHSAGAHIAALLALDARYFAAAVAAAALPKAPVIAGLVGMSGPYDFLPLLEDDVKDMFGPPPQYDQSQPINFVRDDAPPALLIHGLDDVTVWPKNTRNLATALAARGVPVSLKLYPKATHPDTVAALSLPARHRAPTLADIQAFVRAPRHRA